MATLKDSKRALEGRRAFLSADVPFLLGRNPDRVAPAHVVNGFLGSLYGKGSDVDELRVFMRGDGASLNAVTPTILADDNRKRILKAALRTIFDPDHRVFPSGGSPFPLHLALVADGPDDDGYGEELASMLFALDPEFADAIGTAFATEGHEDCMSALAEVTCAGTPNGIALERERTKWLWQFRAGALGKHLTKELAALVIRSAALPYATRSARIVALTRAVNLAIYLGTLRSAALIAEKPSSWSDIAPMYIYGGQPPGDQHRPEVRLAIRSFDGIVAEMQSSLRTLLKDRLESVRIPRSVPESQRTPTRIKLAFPEVTGALLEHAQAMARSARSDATLVDTLLRSLYPTQHISSGERVLGRMLGICGPDRGMGSPRFVIETPILGLLVSLTIKSGETQIYEEWLDNVYDRFGIIFGFGRNCDTVELLADLDDKGPLQRALKANHDALRLRLIKAGLAIEYSDAETEVGRPWSAS